jgi:hypothetical protein
MSGLFRVSGAMVLAAAPAFRQSLCHEIVGVILPHDRIAMYLNTLCVSADKDAAPSPISNSVSGDNTSTELSRGIPKVDARALTLRSVQSVICDPASPHSHITALTINASTSRSDGTVDLVSLDRAARDFRFALDQMEPTPTCAPTSLHSVAGDHRLLDPNR